MSPNKYNLKKKKNFFHFMFITKNKKYWKMKWMLHMYCIHINKNNEK